VGEWEGGGGIELEAFFVYLDGEGVVGGETWFPYLEGKERVGEGKWTRWEGGGVMFSPKKGNAVFWVNLHGNGTGDGRVVHSGLVLEEGRKTGMNIWARKFL